MKNKNLEVKRKELKYYISHNEYVVLSSLLRKVMTSDKHNTEKKSGYVIRSLYFDTTDNKEFEEKMMGADDRSKYRLRLYDLKSDKVKFEIKSKTGEVVFKESATISKADAIEMQKMNYEVMLKYKNPILNKAYKEFKKSHYQPVVLVEYVREAFISDINSIRIVFDKYIKSTSIQLNLYGKDVFFTDRLKGGLVVLEVKFNNFLPDWIKNLIQLPSAERSAISKYCIGRLDQFKSIY